MTMNIQHHPDDSTLMAYAAGSLAEPLTAVVAAHVDMCPHCRRELRTMESIGVALLAALPKASVDRAVPIMALRSMEADVEAPRTSPRSAGARTIPTASSVPSTLRHLIGDDLDQIAWKRLGLGVWHYPLPLSKGTTGDLRLLKVAAGRAMPEHGHGGAELTLMLRGAYTDVIGRFQAGDVADLDHDIHHRPIVDPSEDCICLVASEQKARFTGFLPRLVQPLTGM